MGFVIHWHESAMELHVFPIPIPAPTSLSTRFLWVFPEDIGNFRKDCLGKKRLDFSWGGVFKDLRRGGMRQRTRGTCVADAGGNDEDKPADRHANFQGRRKEQNLRESDLIIQKNRKKSSVCLSTTGLNLGFLALFSATFCSAAQAPRPLPGDLPTLRARYKSPSSRGLPQSLRRPPQEE